MATAIAQLPNESTQNKVVLNVQETNTEGSGNTVEAAGAPSHAPVPTSAPVTELSQESIHQIVQGLQQAGNATQLPTRDIHTNNSQIVQDEQVKPNFIPPTENNNYIEEDTTMEQLIKQGQIKEQEQDRLDALYDELQMPILIMILFFFFQLPYFQKNMIKFVPSLFNNDGNPSLSGYFLKTVLFGLSFYSITKLTRYLSNI